MGYFSTINFLLAIQIKSHIKHNSTQLSFIAFLAYDYQAHNPITAPPPHIYHNTMSVPQPPSGAITYPRLSGIDFEQSTGIIWPILALAALKSELNCFNAEHHPASWNMYMFYLNTVSTVFGDPDSPSNWGALSSDLRRKLYRDLVEASAAFNRAYETNSQEQLFIKYLLRWLEAYNTQLDIDVCTSLAGMSDWTHVFAVKNIRSEVTALMRELTGSIVERHLDALREVQIVSADALHEVQELNIKCATEMFQSIEVYLAVKIDREYLGAQTLPVDFIDRVLGAIRWPLKEHVVIAFADFLKALEDGKGKFSEDDNEQTAAYMSTLFLDMGQAFSYQSDLLHPEDDEDDEEEPVPEHVSNHQYDQYQDNDWFAREYRLIETQPGVLLGPQNAEVDEVSTPVDFDDIRQSCTLCDDSSIQLRQLKVCGHIICQDCLASQLAVVHQCRYKCAYCRAEFFPTTA